MTRDVQYYQNRINLLSNKANVSNARIINKLKRKIRALEAKGQK